MVRFKIPLLEVTETSFKVPFFEIDIGITPLLYKKLLEKYEVELEEELNRVRTELEELKKREKGQKEK